MNNFTKNLNASCSEMRSKRANVIASQTEMAYQNIVNSLRSQKNQIELDIDSMSNMMVEDTKNFNPQEWCEKLQTLSEELHNVKTALKIAEKNFKYFFEDEEENEDVED